MMMSSEFVPFDRTDIHQLRDFLLNQRRVSGWTQEELSERSGVSVRTIRNLETGSNTNPRRTSVALLLSALGAAPAAPSEAPGWDGSCWTALPDRQPEPTHVPQRASTLSPWQGPRPQRDPLVGRQADLRHVLAAAQRSRLIILTGSGGVGKTRLALAAAARLRPLFREGVAVAELRDCPPEHLDPVRTRAELTRVTRELVGEPATASGDSGSPGRRLVVLDGAEHVVQQTARLARRLLDTHPGLHLIVTSRRALASGSAETWEVEPLPVEGHDGQDGRDAGVPGAVELLLRRVQAGLPLLDLAHHLPQVHRLCQLLDGVPLAIEIAAQRLRSLPLSSLLDEQTLFHLLDQADTGGLSAHRTLSESVRWSYDLLPEQHRELLHELVALPDGFSLEQVLTARPARRLGMMRVAHLLAELADASLVQTHRERHYTYRVHALVRHVVAQTTRPAPELRADRVPVQSRAAARITREQPVPAGR
ncbi:helix-turn-helix domain-containing protein [Streptomyces sp. NPDC006984]|uniref:helix-turn-helix domain-containing protein n=1 Tax=Streptomyces sp. NPDC006984 TaxID=3155463 RepID=UPI0033F2F4B5